MRSLTPPGTWGDKISIDSATLMNKGLEVIEAHHLFSLPIDSVARPHPAFKAASTRWSSFNDGVVKAQLGISDMRIPIQYAFSYPSDGRRPSQAHQLVARRAPVTFGEPDEDTFGCLSLAKEAGRAGGTLPCALICRERGGKSRLP